MIVELHSAFYHLPFFTQLPQHGMIHKTFNQIKGTNEHIFLKEFINQVLLDEPVWGRNKYSYDKTKINTVQKIFNFDFFFSNNFQHYHLVDFNTLNSPNYSSWSIVSCHNSNNNCCPPNGFLVHYQLLFNENKIIIHSISHHGPNNPWNALFDLIDPNSYGYDTCLSCHKKYPSTFSSCAYGCVAHKKDILMIAKDIIYLQDSINILSNITDDEIKASLINTQLVFLNNFHRYNLFKGENIIISDLSDLQKFL